MAVYTRSLIFTLFEVSRTGLLAIDRGLVRRRFLRERRVLHKFFLSCRDGRADPLCCFVRRQRRDARCTVLRSIRHLFSTFLGFISEFLAALSKLFGALIQCLGRIRVLDCDNSVLHSLRGCTEHSGEGVPEIFARLLGVLLSL